MNDSPRDTLADDLAFQANLEHTMQLVQAPEGLHARLLQIPELADTADAAKRSAANDTHYLRRLLPVAALLLLAIGVGAYYQPGVNAALADDIFGHIYIEEPFFGDGSIISITEVNARMQPGMGISMEPGNASDSLEITFAKDCLIAKQRSMHLVVKGETGPVNLMMIPSQLVKGEVKIADEHYHGLVTQASGGTLVVVGNKQEPIAQYRDRMVSSLNWEY